jgi:hypothetical protein
VFRELEKKFNSPECLLILRIQIPSKKKIQPQTGIQMHVKAWHIKTTEICVVALSFALTCWGFAALARDFGLRVIPSSELSRAKLPVGGGGGGGGGVVKQNSLRFRLPILASLFFFPPEHPQWRL